MTVVACCQVRLDVADRAGNLRRVAEAVREAAARGAQVIVLPELADTGYAFADRHEAFLAAGPPPDRWQRLSAELGVVLIGGFCELGDDHQLYDSAIMIDNGRVRAVYRKAHLWGSEKSIFSAGGAPAPVITTSAGRIGMIICYDLAFPELVRSVALGGAQLLAVPVNWPVGTHPWSDPPYEIAVAQVAAGGNRMAVAVADRCGSERGLDWIGGSVVVDVDARLMTEPAYGSPAVLRADLDLPRADDKRVGQQNDLHADRRPDLYAAPSPTEVSRT